MAVLISGYMSQRYASASLTLNIPVDSEYLERLLSSIAHCVSITDLGEIHLLALAGQRVEFEYSIVGLNFSVHVAILL